MKLIELSAKDCNGYSFICSTNSQMKTCTRCGSKEDLWFLDIQPTRLLYKCKRCEKEIPAKYNNSWGILELAPKQKETAWMGFRNDTYGICVSGSGTIIYERGHFELTPFDVIMFKPKERWKIKHSGKDFFRMVIFKK